LFSLLNTSFAVFLKVSIGGIDGDCLQCLVNTDLLVRADDVALVGDILTVPDAAATMEEVTENEIFRAEIPDAYDNRYIYA